MALLGRKDDCDDLERSRNSVTSEDPEACRGDKAVDQTCRYFGIARVRFHRWKAALQKRGDAGLVRKKPTPNHQTPPEIVEKALHLRKTYHLGPKHIFSCLERFLDITIFGAGRLLMQRRTDVT
jgi:hypothetical protein